MKEDIENAVVEFSNYAAKSIPGFLINSVTPFETLTGVKKKMSLKWSSQIFF
jgi:hypothetical protein